MLSYTFSSDSGQKGCARGSKYFNQYWYAMKPAPNLVVLALIVKSLSLFDKVRSRSNGNHRMQIAVVSFDLVKASMDQVDAC